jgi:hypothetical protein
VGELERYTAHVRYPGGEHISVAGGGIVVSEPTEYDIGGIRCRRHLNMLVGLFSSTIITSRRPVEMTSGD